MVTPCLLLFLEGEMSRCIALEKLGHSEDLWPDVS